MAVRSTTRVVLSMAEQHAGRLLRTSLELEDMTPRRPSKRGDDGARGRSVGWVSSVVLCEKKEEVRRACSRRHPFPSQTVQSACTRLEGDYWGRGMRRESSRETLPMQPRRQTPP